MEDDDKMSYHDILAQNIEGMKNMLDSINEKLKTHINGVECIEYVKPIRHMIFEAWSDLCENKKPTFYDADDDLDSYYDDEQCISQECEFCGAEDDLKHMIGCPNNETGYNRLMTEGYD